ncbi:MAG: CarD family transcriptional regulator [Acutalibacteraceae bacterium]
MAAGCDQSRGELKMEEKMLKLNDTVMYGTTGVCTVENIEKKTIGKVTRTYYVLRPKAQTSSTVFLPADNEILLSKVRTVMTADEIIGIIRELPAEPNIWVDDDNERKLRYNEIITSGDRKRCLLMVRTLRSHQKELAEKGKRLHIADERALKEGQRLIHDEFSYVLNIEPDEVGNFISAEMSTVQ